MAVIAVIQQKGGVGKSTISANLAGELVRFGRSVAVVDLDPQHSPRQLGETWPRALERAGRDY